MRLKKSDLFRIFWAKPFKAPFPSDLLHFFQFGTLVHSSRNKNKAKCGIITFQGLLGKLQIGKPFFQSAVDPLATDDLLCTSIKSPMKYVNDLLDVSINDLVPNIVPHNQWMSHCLRVCRWKVLVTLLLSNFQPPSVCPVSAHQYSRRQKLKKYCTHSSFLPLFSCPGSSIPDLGQSVSD